MEICVKWRGWSFMISPDPKAMNHFISITDTYTTQEIPRMFKAVYQEQEQNTDIFFIKAQIHRFPFSESFIYMES